MSKATKRKHVTREVLEDFVEPTQEQQIVKVLGGRGNNFHDVLTPSGDQFIASMPTKFRRNVWIKRGDFVVVDPIVEGNKVKGEIVHILYPEQIRYLQERKLWPEAFVEADKSEAREDSGAKPRSAGSDTAEEEEEGGSLEDELGPNPNRPPPLYVTSEDSEESDEDPST